MLRFSIRELMMSVLLVAVGLAWFNEHRLRLTAVAKAKQMQEYADVWQSVSNYRAEETRRICQQLEEHGLQVMWACGCGTSIPIVLKIDPNAALGDIPVSN